MREMKDNQYDLCIVDPPYGIGFDGNSTVKGKSGKANTFSDIQHHIKKDWDSKIPTDEYFNELQRVSKNQIICGGNYFANMLPNSRGWVYWDKKITNKNNHNFSDGELIWTSFNGILKKFTYDWIGFGYLNNPDRQKKIHPTEKPFQLYKWLLKNYAKEGNSILDTHVGSGSSRIACYEMNFDFTGYEIDKDYWEAQEKRFNVVKNQMRLF